MLSNQTKQKLSFNLSKSLIRALHSLPKPPYRVEDGIFPAISSKTLDFHYNKHFAGYINKLNGFVKGTSLENKTLEETIKETAKDETKKAIFNNAAQAFNHNFYFNCMRPFGTQIPDSVKKILEKNFGSFDEFKKQFSEKANGLFGSGWCWLYSDNKKLGIMQASNAMTPLVFDQKPILVIDVWEHAYYLDYQNKRPDSVDKFFEVINWNFVEEQMKKADLI
ncbi:superoxide dismutase [Anaeramoeba ignava]|uniref:Superoxide dismutase n=1 Tax=Anaeramoeba ignava TaxID=1746090 RepID=A0A9Q0LS05_ANAIG|nr:superoxide dismutase [Anaeramoeba ignava]|eukprot:Anaeramoba_ignava/a2580_83.p1 GENE.a2580_83~~a2580_83.p1  ORF type:complete len:222 (+),score=84.55 a2580_83:13-678(+)